jgi:hypothetical protein
LGIPTDSTRPETALVSDRSNRSLGPQRTKMLRTANILIGGSRKPHSEFERVTRYHAWVTFRRFLHLTVWVDRAFGVKDGFRWSLDAKRLARLAAMAEADETWLKEQHCVSLGSPAR